MHGPLEEQAYVAAGQPAGTSSSGGLQLVGGLFLQGVFAPAEPLRIEASVRADAWRNFDGRRTENGAGTIAYEGRSDAALSPRLGLAYRAAAGLTPRGSVYRAFRAPTLSEQYRQFVSGNNLFRPNPDLGPERLTGGDVGIAWQPLPVGLTWTGP